MFLRARCDGQHGYKTIVLTDSPTKPTLMGREIKMSGDIAPLPSGTVVPCKVILSSGDGTPLRGIAKFGADGVLGEKLSPSGCYSTLSHPLTGEGILKHLIP